MLFPDISHRAFMADIADFGISPLLIHTEMPLGLNGGLCKS
jgi:hypothetical protein